jgi:hypothetical protein
MRILPKVAFAALLLGAPLATSAFAANDTGCPPGMHRAEAGGVGSLNLNTRKAESETGGVGSTPLNTRKAESEAGGPGSTSLNTRKAEAETGGVGSQQQLSAIPCTK